MKKLLIILGLISVSCEKEYVICDTSFRSYNLYVKDTLKYIIVEDINNNKILYCDSEVYPDFKVIDDGYLNVLGRNNRTTLNIKFLYVKDRPPLVQRVHSVCITTDDCHVNFNYPSDTL